MALIDAIKQAELTGRRLAEAYLYDLAPAAERLRRLLKKGRESGELDRTISEEVRKFLEKDRHMREAHKQFISMCLEVDKGFEEARTAGA